MGGTVSYAEESPRVTVTPWCANSIRIRIAPSTSKAAPLPESALVEESCKPGDSKELSSEISQFESGNLRVTHQSDGTLTFSRVDTYATLFSATTSFLQSV